ncbi:hypothetical protein [Mycolicibacterium palauense]|uniref:hypothetical protein n=1 Tax=Mycolicibacterium palauense TaxID=2034511 RepID=UPI000BFEACF8|nr:hypothetical protein [Mycolicibacterium palauense]
MSNAFTRRVSRYVAVPAAALAIAGSAAVGLAATSNAAPEIGNGLGQVAQVQPFNHDLNNLNNLRPEIQWQHQGWQNHQI